MVTVLMIFQALLAVVLILLVLVQFGKGAEVGLMGGGASDAVLTGTQKGNILVKITAVISVLFMVNSLVLARMQSNITSKSILDNESPIARPLSTEAKKDAVPAAAATPVDAAPATTAPAPETKK